MSITEFLEARIAEDEAEAQPMAALEDDDRGGWAIAYAARVLAECKAKRAIIGLHADREGDCEQCSCYGYFAVTDGFHDHEEFPCPTLCATATVYADHQDYDPAWISHG